MQYNIKADSFQLPLAIRQILFLNRVERKLEEREKELHAGILVEDAEEKIKIIKEWEK